MVVAAQVMLLRSNLPLWRPERLAQRNRRYQPVWGRAIHFLVHCASCRLTGSTASWWSPRRLRTWRRLVVGLSAWTSQAIVVQSPNCLSTLFKMGTHVIWLVYWEGSLALVKRLAVQPTVGWPQVWAPLLATHWGRRGLLPVFRVEL